MGSVSTQDKKSAAKLAQLKHSLKETERELRLVKSMPEIEKFVDQIKMYHKKIKRLLNN